MARGVLAGVVEGEPIAISTIENTNPLKQNMIDEPPAYYSLTSGRDLHVQRRRDMLDKYPKEIKALFGHDPYEGLFCICTVVLQLLLAYAVRGMESGWLLLFLTYTVSGTLNHSLLLAMHESTHDLFFSKRWANQLCSYICNLPMGVPAASMFKMYHSEHHTGMGIERIDTDIPTETEAKIFKGPIGKAIWLVLQPFFYGIRPFIVHPISFVRVIVVLVTVFQFMFDFAIYHFLGWRSFFYLFGGTLLGAGLHPMSGHFVAEHFVFVTGQETYSYYGPLNYLTYNVGHHREHHDFPNIPGSRLPELKKIAPEFYPELSTHSSWVGVILAFIFNPNITLYSRILRLE
jgi:sphingolipid 4-desaturase/C4-monooxygenase